MVTWEINSLWKTFNFFYTDCSANNAFCIAQQFKIWSDLLLYTRTLPLTLDKILSMDLKIP